jgi:hypothetical protein
MQSSITIIRSSTLDWPARCPGCQAAKRCDGRKLSVYLTSQDQPHLLDERSCVSPSLCLQVVLQRSIVSTSEADEEEAERANVGRDLNELNPRSNCREACASILAGICNVILLSIRACCKNT